MQLERDSVPELDLCSQQVYVHRHSVSDAAGSDSIHAGTSDCRQSTARAPTRTGFGKILPVIRTYSVVREIAHSRRTSPRRMSRRSSTPNNCSALVRVPSVKGGPFRKGTIQGYQEHYGEPEPSSRLTDPYSPTSGSMTRPSPTGKGDTRSLKMRITGGWADSVTGRYLRTLAKQRQF